MGKQTTAFELMLPVRDSGMTAHRWLCEALRAKILAGHLRPGSRIPGTRDLANQYGLSRGTIVYAFERLKSEGYLEGSVGSGTYVSKILPDQLLQVRRESKELRPVQRKQRWKISKYGRRVKPFPIFSLRHTRAFRANMPALDLFPTTLWAQLTARCLRHPPANLLLGCEPLGYRPLRDAVAGYLATSRGVKCAPEQIAIVSGVQEALDLVARLFLNPGDRVCMEDPGYIGASMVFEAVGAKVCPVPLDDEGMKLHYSKLRGSRLIYVTPAHQFPLGIMMSLPRRLQLLDWACKSGALIFEDDYDSEYRFSGHPVPALQGLDRNGVVLFAGTFSKVLFPSLRLGYLVIPPDLLTHFAAAKSLTNRHCPLLEQAVLCDFITDGQFGLHLRRMREVYAERLFVLLDEARQKLSGLIEISNVDAGLQTVGWLCNGIDGEAAAKAAASRDVEVIPLSRFTRGRLGREALQIGFAAVDAGEIRRGVRELALALEMEIRNSSRKTR